MLSGNVSQFSNIADNLKLHFLHSTIIVIMLFGGKNIQYKDYDLLGKGCMHKQPSVTYRNVMQFNLPLFEQHRTLCNKLKKMYV